MKRILLESIIRAYQWMSVNRVFERYLLIIAVLLPFAISACSIDVRMGRRPDIQNLEKSLRLQESTSRDVLAALGEPFGKGKAMLPGFHSTPRVMWSYYYGEASLKDSRNTFLFVYFDQDRYDGYMWFSSFLNKSPTSSLTQPKKDEPKIAQFYNDRGVAYSSEGEYDEAISDFNKAVKTTPNFAVPFYNRARCYYFKKEYDKAWDDSKRAQDLGFKVPPEFFDDLRKASGREK